MTDICAHDARMAHWRQKWVIPNTTWRISGFSRAANRTGFYIPDLDIMLDAGPQCYNHPQQIFITHTHGDHIACLPFTLIGADEMPEKTQLHAPKAAESHIIKYINALFEASAMMPIEELLADRTESIYAYNGYDTPTIFRTTCKKTLLQVSVVLCDHSIPTISYCFSEVKNKLKVEYAGTPGTEIAKLRKEGTAVTEEVVKHAFAYICDTSIEILTAYPEILTFPVVFIECTFLYPEEKENAVATKHIHWEDLKPYVLAYQDILFVLIHFSLRYKDAEILEFFANEQASHSGLIPNIKVWAGDTSV